MDGELITKGDEKRENELRKRLESAGFEVYPFARGGP